MSTLFCPIDALQESELLSLSNSSQIFQTLSNAPGSISDINEVIKVSIFCSLFVCFWVHSFHEHKKSFVMRYHSSSHHQQSTKAMSSCFGNHQCSVSIASELHGEKHFSSCYRLTQIGSGKTPVDYFCFLISCRWNANGTAVCCLARPQIRVGGWPTN